MSEAAIQGEIVKSYLTIFPDTPSLTLAKKIYREQKVVFNSVETVRNRIRYYRGQQGKGHLKKLSTKEFLKPEGDKCPFDSIPEGLTDIDDWSIFTLKGVKKPLILADIHIPYHDKPDLITALEYGKKKNIDSILLLGDCLDFYSISHFEKDPRRRNLSDEVHTFYGFMEELRREFPDIRIFFKEGNHEERYLREAKVKAPDFLDIAIKKLEELIRSDEYGLEVIKDKKPIQFGDLALIHGHEFGRSFTSPVNASRGLFLKGKMTAMCAHYHQSSSDTKKDIMGNIIACWSVGCLCDLHPRYRPINDWNRGFAIIESDGNDFMVHNHRIIKHRVYYA